MYLDMRNISVHHKYHHYLHITTVCIYLMKLKSNSKECYHKIKQFDWIIVFVYSIFFLYILYIFLYILYFFLYILYIFFVYSIFFLYILYIFLYILYFFLYILYIFFVILIL